MNCQKCGTELKGENIFCTECGHKQLPTLPKVFGACFILIQLLLLFSTCVILGRPYYKTYSIIFETYRFSPLVMLVYVASLLLFFFFITCVTILPTKKMYITICLLHVVQACVFSLDVGVVSFSFLVWFIIPSGVLLCLIVTFKNNYICQILMSILYAISAKGIISMLRGGSIPVRNILECSIFAAIIIAGIILGDILRKKLSYKYYIK